jgi:hypothetical protein
MRLYSLFIMQRHKGTKAQRRKGEEKKRKRAVKREQGTKSKEKAIEEKTRDFVIFVCFT